MQPKPLNKPSSYVFECMPLGEEYGSGYLVICPDLPGCVSDGATLEEAYANGLDAMECWIEAAKEWGRKVPPPSFKVPPDAVNTTAEVNARMRVLHISNPGGKTQSELVDERLDEFLGI